MLMRFRMCMFCAALLLACCASWSVASAEGTKLFSADVGAVEWHRPAHSLLAEGARPEAAPHGGAFSEHSGSAELRSREARIDLGHLSAARLSIEKGHSVRLNLNLFADAEFEAVFEHTVPTASGYSLRGRLADAPLSTVVLTVSSGILVGTVWGPDGIYEARSTGGTATVRQLNSAGLLRCGLGTEPPSSSPSGSVSATAAKSRFSAAAAGLPNGFRASVDRNGFGAVSASEMVVPMRNSADSADEGDVIDLLVVYPKFARLQAGGHRAMRARIEHGVDLANEAYRASGVAFQIVHVAAEVDYGGEKPTTSHAALRWLQDPSDGHLDEVHELRNAYAADIVTLYNADMLWSLANPVDPRSENASASAFNYANVQTLSHELGHNMGLMHSWWDPYGRGIFPYSMGHNIWDATTGPLDTIMSRSGGEPLNRFSNPLQKYPDESGEPLGVPGDEWPADPNARVGPADAVRSMNETRRMVANFRRSANRCAYALSTESATVPAAGGEFTIDVHVDPSCSWKARALDGFVFVTAGSSGTGDGKVTYRVQANDNWHREGAVQVAGEIHFVEQLGGRSITPVCSRSEWIQDALYAALGDDFSCEDKTITEADLATVHELHKFVSDQWNYDGPIALKQGDLDGLGNLRKFGVDVRNPFMVHEGAFEGLSNLRDINLALTFDPNLSANVFAGLDGLERLSISSTNPLALPPGVFAGLDGLEWLFIRSASPLALPPGVFAGLDGLEWLFVSSEKFLALSAGVFTGLSSLSVLDLYQNTNWYGSSDAPMALVPRHFEGLPDLKTLRISAQRMHIRRGTFEYLSGLRNLSLQEGQLTTIEPGAFEGLANLQGLHMQWSGLRALEPGWANGLVHLRILTLDWNHLSKIPSLQGLANLSRLAITGNLIESVTPLLAHDWRGGDFINLGGNPLDVQSLKTHIPVLRRRGAEVVVEPNLSLYSISAEEGRDLDFQVKMLPAAPVDVMVPWAVFDRSAKASQDYASVSHGSLTIRAGETDGIISIPTIDDDLVEPDEYFYLRLENPPPASISFLRRGAELIDPFLAEAVGIIRDNDLSVISDVAMEIELVDAFRNNPSSLFNIGGVITIPGRWSSSGLADGMLTYRVESANPDVAKVVVGDGLATISAGEPGMTTVTVTATDSQSRTVTRTFFVTVKPSLLSMKSIWGGWRSVLLQQQPPAGDGDEP